LEKGRIETPRRGSSKADSCPGRGLDIALRIGWKGEIGAGQGTSLESVGEFAQEILRSEEGKRVVWEGQKRGKCGGCSVQKTTAIP